MSALLHELPLDSGNAGHSEQAQPSHRRVNGDSHPLSRLLDEGARLITVNIVYVLHRKWDQVVIH